MSKRSVHLSKKEILLLIDLEGPPDQMERARQHLADCSECREHRMSLENMLNRVEDFYASESFRTVSPAARLRTQLMQELAAAKPRRAWLRGMPSYSWGKTAAAIVVLVLMAGFGLLGLNRIWITQRATVSQWTGNEPNPSLTPGSVRAVTLTQVCSTENDDLDPKVAPTTEKAVLREYGVFANAPRQSYQIDYLINPQLGGTSDIRNLWPQPYSNREWNAYAKDELEKRLHQMVCSGSVNLSVAQKEIATDWIAAYKKYVHQPYPT